MKIKDLETFVVAPPAPGWGGSYFIFVKLTTDNGIVGYGEVYANTFGPEATVAGIQDIFLRWVEGANPFQIELFWRRAYSAGYIAKPDVSLVGIISGLEIAMWDIVGKAVGQPIYNLMGGKVRERLRSYTYLYPSAERENDPGFWTDPDAHAEQAAHYVEQGFTAVKFDPAGPYTITDPHMPRLDDISRSVAFLKKIREAVGDRADLLFGTHGQFSTGGAIRLARALEPFDPLWFEEPTPAETPEEMARVASQTNVPVATGERLTTKYEFKRVLETKAASILQPALARVGGILEAKKIAGMAEPFYAQMAPHLYCGPIEALANIQLCACIPNFLILESIKTFDGFYADLLDKPIRWEDGAVIPSTEPGLGHNLNEDVARAHPYTGDRLHLNFTQEPIWP